MSSTKALFLIGLAALAVARAASAANVDGANVHWTSTGSGSQAVIFVHGWTCDESSWSAQVPAFSAKYRVITLDLPGHGKSAAPANGKFSMENFARAVEAVRAEAGVDRVVVVGHSMGTPVVRVYQQMYPQHVAGLVIVDGAVLVPGAAFEFTPPPLTGAEGLTAREGMIRGMFSASTSPALQDHILKMMLGAPESTADGRDGRDVRSVMAERGAREGARAWPIRRELAARRRRSDENGFPDRGEPRSPGNGPFLDAREAPRSSTSCSVTSSPRSADMVLRSSDAPPCSRACCSRRAVPAQEGFPLDGTWRGEWGPDGRHAAPSSSS